MELANRFQFCFSESLEVLCQTFRTAERLLRCQPTTIKTASLDRSVDLICN
ncbi:hypothetical protein [Nostoc sp. FACHB-888]|uniref:hypothetical protein n=1 Tax=Nostoc sp. FACHB-888 TaxID=2692842 RepID=UPI001683FA26|nr:hypothetical protein [Nostoc sp. FACHB-888]MBD2249350.1 hypothetical protein [Nostoc sp. FACHB-888]